MYTYLEKILLRVVIHRTRVVEKKRKLRVPFSPSTNRNRVHRTKISTKTDKDGFLACGVQVKIGAKNSCY